MESTFRLSGNIVDVVKERIFKGTITIKNGKIENIIEEETDSIQYILPGVIDAHIHIESSMLTPSEFARIAVVHGTVATVSDPHEIANVLGIDGVQFMIENGKQVGSVTVGVATMEDGSDTWDTWKRERLLQVGADILAPHWGEADTLLRYLFAD